MSGAGSKPRRPGCLLAAPVADSEWISFRFRPYPHPSGERLWTFLIRAEPHSKFGFRKVFTCRGAQRARGGSGRCEQHMGANGKTTIQETNVGGEESPVPRAGAANFAVALPYLGVTCCRSTMLRSADGCTSSPGCPDDASRLRERLGGPQSSRQRRERITDAAVKSTEK